MVPVSEQVARTLSAISHRDQLRPGLQVNSGDTHGHSVANFLCSQRSFELIRANQNIHDGVYEDVGMKTNSLIIDAATETIQIRIHVRGKKYGIFLQLSVNSLTFDKFYFLRKQMCYV